MKVAVSIPDQVFATGERVAKRLRVSRSRFYARAVEAYAKAHSGADVTQAIDAALTRVSNKTDRGWERPALEVLRREKW